MMRNKKFLAHLSILLTLSLIIPGAALAFHSGSLTVSGPSLVAVKKKKKKKVKKVVKKNIKKTVKETVKEKTKTPPKSVDASGDTAAGSGSYKFPSFSKISENAKGPDFITGFDDNGWALRGFTDMPGLEKIAFPGAPYSSLKKAGYWGVSEQSAFAGGYTLRFEKSVKEENPDQPELNIARIDFVVIPAKTAEDKAMSVEKVAEAFFEVEKKNLQTGSTTKAYCPEVVPYYETKTFGSNNFRVMSWYCKPAGGTQIAWLDSPYIFLKSPSTGDIFAMAVRNKNSGWKLGKPEDVGFAKTMSILFLDQLLPKIVFN